jgi:glycosyltransferase involved in cell wall biosynthesis
MLLGEPPPHWRSLERSYQVCQRAHELATSSTTWLPEGGPRTQVGEDDFRLYFRIHPSEIGEIANGPPSLIALHGSCVLERALVYRLVSSLRECDAVVVTCSSDVDIIRSFRHKPAPQVLKISLGTSLGIQTGRPKALLRAALHLDQDTRIVSCVSRLIPHKNAHIFLELVSQLRRRHKLIGILCGDYWDDYPSGIGGAAYREWLRDLFDSLKLDRHLLRMDGSLSDDELSLLLGGSDILIHPSLAVDENYGFAPVEAVACGTPVIATGYGGMKDNVVDGLTGLKVRTWVTDTGARADFRSILACADGLLRDDAKLSKLREGCIAARGAFSPDDAVSALASMIHHLVALHASGHRRQCVAPPLDPVSRSPRWAVEGIEATWPQLEPSVAQYASSPDPVNASQFTAVRRFGRQTLRDGRLSVVAPVVRFSGPVAPDEADLLEGVGDQWLPVKSLGRAQLEVVTRLLRAGVLTATQSAP